MHMSSRIILAALVFLLLPCCWDASSMAINITIHHDTGDDDNPVWDPDGSRLIGMFEAAAQIWESLLPGEGNHAVDVKWDDDFSALGQWNLDFEPFSNNNIRINPANPWFIDSTPFDNSEYDFLTQNASGSPRSFFGGTWHVHDLTSTEVGAGFYGTPPGVLEVGYRGRAAAGSPLLGQLDLLSTVLHELGHELGVNSLNLGPGWDFDPQFVGGVTGSGVRRTGGHLVPRATLMSASGGIAGTRRLPSAADVLAAAEHHGHSTVSLDRIEFIAGSEWHVGNNWIGGRVPHANADAYMRNPDRLNTVELTATARARNLFLGERTWLSTNDNSLIVGAGLQGTLTIDGASLDTRLFVDAGGSVQTGNLLLQNRGSVSLRGGDVIVLDEEVQLLDSESFIEGWGTLTLLGAERLVNDGRIRPNNGATLTLVAAGAGEFDLDGASGNGELDVRQGNLVVNGPVRDAYDGTFTLQGNR